MPHRYEQENEKTARELSRLSSSLQDAVLDDSVEMETVQRHASDLIGLAFKEKERRLFRRQRYRSAAKQRAALSSI